MPAEILKHLQNEISSSLKKTDSDSHAGMDIAICCFDLKKNEIEFAGAKRPLWIIRNNEMIIYAADKFSIGSQYYENESFTNHIINIQTGDAIFIFSDGFPDQFGGENGKKLLTNNFKELLLSIQSKNINEQGKLLRDHFQSWKGSNEQVDDVMVIGIKI